MRKKQKDLANILSLSPENIEPLQDYDDWEEKEIDIKTEIPSIKEKSLYSEVELRTLTEEFIDKEYPINTWTHVYTDGSAEKAIKNGGAGI